MGAISHDHNNTESCDVQRAPPHFHDRVALADEQLLETNFGRVADHQCLIFLGTGLNSFERSQLIDLL